jgi:signal transduction histidine kinase
MKIRSKLMLSAAASIGAALIIGAVIYFFLHQVETQRKEVLLVETLLQEESELRYIAVEYLLHHEPRASALWLSKYRRISGLLELLTANGAKKEIAESVRKNHKGVGVIFDMLAADDGEVASPGGGAPDARLAATPLRDSEVILGGQLLLRTQVVESGLLRLFVLNNRDAVRAQKEAALAVVLSVAVLVATILAAFLSTMKSLVRPIEELRSGTEVVGAGDLDFRLGTDRPDEIGDLGRSFDRMTVNLQSINRELEAFSYSVSHDLRAPLRHISGYIDLLKRHIPGGLDEKGRHYVEMITDSGAKMGRLIDDLLSFSRMGRVEMRRERVSLAAVLKSVQEDLSGETSRRVIRWETTPLPEVHGDPSMLRVVLTNLVSNAVKFTRARPEAVIRTGWREGANGEAVIFVRDNGVGFDMKYVDKLFGVFQRLHSAAEFEGTGVGLANVRRIVHRHGGKTWAEGAVGEGATFYFTIPGYGGGA